MNGMHRENGQPLVGIDHLRQSIRDILTTPIGSRVMRRDYGSRLFELVDAPLNPVTLTDIYVATAEALRRWEPRFLLTQVQAEAVTPGQVTLTLTGEYLPDGQAIVLEGVEL